MGVLPAQAASIPEKSLHSGLSYKRLERGRFTWPPVQDGAVTLSRDV